MLTICSSVVPGAKPTECKKYFPSVGETLRNG